MPLIATSIFSYSRVKPLFSLWFGPGLAMVVLVLNTIWSFALQKSRKIYSCLLLWRSLGPRDGARGAFCQYLMQRLFCLRIFLSQGVSVFFVKNINEMTLQLVIFRASFRSYLSKWCRNGPASELLAVKVPGFSFEW